MGIVQTALIPAAGFIIGYQAYKSLNYWGWLGLGTIVSVGLVLAFTEESPNFQAENVDNALITGSVEGDPAMFLFTKGHKDDTGFTTGRIMVDDDLDEIHDTITDIQEDVGEDRIKTGFKSWKRNVWGLKPYSAEESLSYGTCKSCGKGPEARGTHKDHLCNCDYHRDEARRLALEGREWPFPSPDRSFFCFDCAPNVTPNTIFGEWEWDAEEFEAVTDDWIVNMKRFNPLSRHYVPKKKEVAAAAESFNADYCSTCVVREHDSCPLEEGCRCCDNTMKGIYRSKSYGAEDYEAESYREFFEEIEKLMNETAGTDWNLYAETKDGTVSVTIDYTPLDPEFFDDYGELFEESDEKESEHTTPQLCSLCGQPYRGYGNNPEPVVPMSEGQCCDTCNTTIVIPARMRGMGFMAETMVQRRARTRGLIARLEKSEKKRSTNKPLGHGIKRNFWKGIFSSKKEAETFEAQEGVCLFCDETEDLETVNLDGWPEEICEHCLDPTNWMDAESFNAEALARWDGRWKGIGWTPEEEANLSEEEKEKIAEQIYNDWEAGKIEATDVDEYWERMSAEQTLKGKVRTMSGKPHKTRKLVKDKDITAEEAATRLKLESPNDAYGLAYNQGFDDARIAKRWSSTGTKKMTYSPDDSYKEDEKLFEDTYRRRE